MLKKTETEGTSVQIQQNQSFLSDAVFESIRKQGTQWINIVNNKTAKSIGMDSAMFHNDTFELVIDVRGCSLENLKCIMTPNSVEVTAEKMEASGCSRRQASIVRNYQLHQPVLPELGSCWLSSEGILLIRVPWSN